MATYDASNLTTVAQHLQHEDNKLLIVKTALYSFIFVLGMFGNFVVIKATRQYLTLRRPTNILICNLCVCDMFIMLLGIPLFVLGEDRLMQYFGVNSCKIVYPMLTAVLSATVFTLVVIAIERYDVIVNSVHTKLQLTPNKAIYIIICLDVISLMFAVPLCFTHFKTNSFHCERNWTPLVKKIFLIILFLVQYLIPLVLMVFLYSLCWHKIRKKNKATIQISTTHRDTFRRSRCMSESQAMRSKYASAEHLPKEQETFTSSSKNHLAGIKRKSVRRSFSADSVYDLQHEQDKQSSFLHATRRSSSFHESSVSFMENSLKAKHSLVGHSRQSLFMGSVQKIQQSLTSLIIGADGMDALTAFATKRVKQTLKTLKVFSFILLAFALCMLPHHVIHFMYSLDDAPTQAKFFEIFIYINAAVNPWIYAGMNKSYRIAFAAMFRKHKRRRVSTNVMNFSTILDEQQSRVLCCEKLFSVCWKHQSTIDNDGEELALEGVNERRDTLRSLDFSFQRNGVTRHSIRLNTSGSRKDSKSSRKGSIVSEHDHIPSLAPIIIITNYDEELAAQQALIVKCSEEDDSQRFSAILSFNDA